MQRWAGKLRHPRAEIVQVGVRDTAEHAAQLDNPEERVVHGRKDREAAGVRLTPIFNQPIDWIWTV